MSMHLFSPFCGSRTVIVTTSWEGEAYICSYGCCVIHPSFTNQALCDCGQNSAHVEFLPDGSRIFVCNNGYCLKKDVALSTP